MNQPRSPHDYIILNNNDLLPLINHMFSNACALNIKWNVCCIYGGTSYSTARYKITA